MIEENFSGGAGFFDRDEEESRVLSRVETPEDREAEPTLRPRRFEDYIGQTKVKENLKIYIEAAKQRGDALDHVLLYGPPGLGKTTLAGIIGDSVPENFGLRCRSKYSPKYNYKLTFTLFCGNIVLQINAEANVACVSVAYRLRAATGRLTCTGVLQRSMP